MQRTRKSRYFETREEELSDVSDISGPDLDIVESTAKKSNQKRKKRHKFSYVEDLKMLKYIMTESRYDEIKGIALWKNMELLEITSHTSQSMKYHFLNTIIPNLQKYNIQKSWVEILFNTHPDLIPSTNKKTYNSILDTLQEKKHVLRISTPINAANKALRELKDLQGVKTTLLQKLEEADKGEEEGERRGGEGEVAEGNRIEENISEDELNENEEQLLKRKHKYQQKVKPTRNLSTSESEIEDASVATSTKETDHCVPSHQGSITEEPSDSSDYDRNLIDMAKKTVNSSNPSQERLSESSSSSEVEERVHRDRRSRLLRKRKLQKAAQQSKSNDNRVKTSEEDFVIKIINDMCSNFQLDVKEVLATLGSTNGDVNQAISYIKFGSRLSGVLPWTQEEDDIISSTDKQQFREILQKRGHVAVAQRLQFLENL